VARAVVAGERSASSDAVRDAVVLGAAGALVAHDAVLAQGTGGVPLGERIAAALPRATEAIDSGAAVALLDRWIAVSTRLAGR
jgi:anthranilate phosphoribosyltransferase